LVFLAGGARWGGLPLSGGPAGDVAGWWWRRAPSGGICGSAGQA